MRQELRLEMPVTTDHGTGVPLYESYSTVPVGRYDIDWLVGWLVWLVGWWLVGWLVVGWLVGLVGWLVG